MEGGFEPDGGHGTSNTGFDPADLQRAYNLPSATAGSGQTVGVVIVGDNPDDESDLATYRAAYGLPPCTTANGCFKKVNRFGEQRAYPAPAGSNWAVEGASDIEMVSAICPNCHIILVEAPGPEEDSTLATAENTAVALGANEITNSWGHAQKPEDLSYEEAFNHPGVMITVASGDHGYTGAEWPDESPHVLAVGGTSLFEASNARGFEEFAWSLGGSGCQPSEPKPSWQTDTGCPYRTTSDISAVADWKNSPVSIYDVYEHNAFGEIGWESWGGTSASSPIIAATYALTNAYTRSLGPQAIWQYAKEGGSLNDIISGKNSENGCAVTYLCWAGPGFDGPTGWGTPWGAPVVAPPPSVTPNGATNLGATHVDLTAYVNPNGAGTSYQFEYGRTAGYGSRIPASFEGIGSGTQGVFCWNEIAGLEVDATYHFRVVATSAAGTTYGPDEVFTTGPLIGAHGVTNLSTSHTDLTAYVDPNSFETSYQFEYGKTTKYGSKIPSAFEGIGSGTQALFCWNEITGLEPDTTYHFRIAVTYGGNTVYSPDEAFTTGPILTPNGVTNLSTTHADLTDYVNPNSFETSYQFQYGKTTKYGSNMPSALEGIGSGTQAIYTWNEITGLEPATTYHFRIALTYGGVTTYGPDEEFTTNPIVTLSSIAALPNGNYVLAAQTSKGELWTVTGSPGSETWTAQNMAVTLAAGTSPSIAALPNGSYVLAAQTSKGELWTITGTPGSKTWTTRNMLFGMAAGTSPSIAGLSNGHYELAVQANTNALWTMAGVPGAETWTGRNMSFGMMAGTSPSVAALPNGNYELAAQANTSALWTMTGAPGAETWTGRNMSFGMMAGTSPSVAALPNGNYELAAQTSKSELWTLTGSPGAETWTGRNMTFGMMPGTNPSIAALPNGKFELAAQASKGELWTLTGSPGAETWTGRNMAFGMAPGSSPSTAALPNGNYILSAQATKGEQWTITGTPAAETWTSRHITLGP